MVCLRPDGVSDTCPIRRMSIFLFVFTFHWERVSHFDAQIICGCLKCHQKVQEGRGEAATDQPINIWFRKVVALQIVCSEMRRMHSTPHSQEARRIIVYWDWENTEKNEIQ